MMQPDPELVDALRRLVAGEIEPECWINWWHEKSGWLATVLNRGQVLRLRPPPPGGFGPPSRCAMCSQLEAVKLLEQWGVDCQCSTRYRDEWEAEFKEFRAREEAKRIRRRKLLLPAVRRLAIPFPSFAAFLKKTEVVENIGPAATEKEIGDYESSFGLPLPSSYKQFLLCCRSVELGDTLKFGLPYTFVFHATQGTALPTEGMLCFGDCWLEGDGDQVLLGKAVSGRDGEPPVLYYAHEASPPTVRTMADSFHEWIEGISRWDVWDTVAS